MASRTITLKSQRLNCFGPAPSTKWGGTFNWTASGVGPGNGTWGMKSAACMASSPIQKFIFMRWTGITTMTVTGVVPSSRGFNKRFSAPVFSTWTITDTEHLDGKGYFFVYPDRVTNHQAEFFPSYAFPPGGTSGWAKVVTGTSGWTIR